jgi:hypothetical protein
MNRRSFFGLLMAAAGATAIGKLLPKLAPTPIIGPKWQFLISRAALAQRPVVPAPSVACFYNLEELQKTLGARRGKKIFFDRFQA